MPRLCLAFYERRSAVQVDFQKKDNKLVLQLAALKESDTLPGCDASDLGAATFAYILAKCLLRAGVIHLQTLHCCFHT